MGTSEALKEMLDFVNRHNGCQGVEILEESDDKLTLLCAACFARQEEAQTTIEHSLSFDVSAEWQSILAERKGLMRSLS